MNNAGWTSTGDNGSTEKNLRPSSRTGQTDIQHSWALELLNFVGDISTHNLEQEEKPSHLFVQSSWRPRMLHPEQYQTTRLRRGYDGRSKYMETSSLLRSISRKNEQQPPHWRLQRPRELLKSPEPEWLVNRSRSIQSRHSSPSMSSHRVHYCPSLESRETCSSI